MTEFVIADVIEHKIPREEFPENNFHTSIYLTLDIFEKQFCVILRNINSNAIRI